MCDEDCYYYYYHLLICKAITPAEEDLSSPIITNDLLLRISCVVFLLFAIFRVHGFGQEIVVGINAHVGCNVHGFRGDFFRRQVRVHQGSCRGYMMNYLFCRFVWCR